MKENKYIETVGRRKTSVARVRITEESKASFTVNDKPSADFFSTPEFERTAKEPLQEEALESKKFKVTVVVKGGGVSSQAEAIRQGIARALTEYDITLRGSLKKKGFLKRDPRMKERRKFGLKKARKAPQWSKR